MTNNYRIAVATSRGGGLFKYLAKNVKTNVSIALLITDNPNSPSIKSADQFGIEVEIIGKEQLSSQSSYFEDLVSSRVDLIVLAGFLPLIPAAIVRKLPRKIINVHPSLLPRHGGIGMIGVKVHESVFDSGDTISGCTVHFVNEVIDGGEIIEQKSIMVDRARTPWEFGALVHALEGPLLLKAINELANKKSLASS